MERREFLGSSCKMCMLMAAGYFFPALTSCAVAKYGVYKTTLTDKKLSIPLSIFNQSALQLVRPEGWYFDIAVERKPDNTFSALLLQCTHQENQLTATPKGYLCSLHGSQFDKEGNVRKGPAQQALEQYATSIENDFLIIQIPNSPM